MQALPRAYGDCWLEASVQPTLLFFTSASLLPHSFIRTMDFPAKAKPLCEIFQAVAEGFGKEDSLNTCLAEPDNCNLLLHLNPQQELPFTMDMTDFDHRHLLAPKVQEPLKTLILFIQMMQIVFKCFGHLGQAALQAEAQRICHRSSSQQCIALPGEERVNSLPCSDNLKPDN